MIIKCLNRLGISPRTLGKHLLPAYWKSTSNRPFSFKPFTITFRVRREVNRISGVFTRGLRRADQNHPDPCTLLSILRYHYNLKHFSVRMLLSFFGRLLPTHYANISTIYIEHLELVQSKFLTKN